MKKQPLTLKEKQAVFLDILKELDKFCIVHNIIYYLGCGTLIGAVRHNGFIPWDDDLDVFMPRPDYLRFCEEYKSDTYIVHTIYNDKSHAYPFGLMCDKRLYSFIGKRRQYNCGIDIYVINGAPSTREEQLKHIDNVFKYIHKKNTLKKCRDRLIYHNLWPFKNTNFILMNWMMLKLDKEFEKYDYSSSEFIWPFGGGKLILKKELYGTPIRIKFEDGLFLAPEHYPEVLMAGYGDYMTPPEESKRLPAHRLDFYWE